MCRSRFPLNITRSSLPFYGLDGNLPNSVGFLTSSNGFNFNGTVDATTASGDYPLTMTAQIVGSPAPETEIFHFIVGKAPTYQGFSTYNLVVNQPANLVLNPGGYPKNALGSLPGMTASFDTFIPFGLGLQVQPGPMDGSIQITGTPVLTGQFFGLLHASNGVAPDLSQAISYRVIKAGDINADGAVDCKDVAMVQGALNKKLGYAGYNNLADVNNDGIVNSQDLLLVAKYLPTGTRCP